MTGARAVTAVEAAIDALRRGHTLCIDHGDTALLLCAADQISEENLLSFLQAHNDAELLISGRRAAVLNITAQRVAAGRSAVALNIPQWANAGWIVAVADPQQDLASPMKGPFHPQDLGAHDICAQAALELLRLARLLPAALIARIKPGPAALAADDILHYSQNITAQLKIVARAKVPLRMAENAEIIAFRADDGGIEHLAILIGDPPRGAPVLARIHSECFTGDLLGSLKCDCGDQLQGALHTIADAGGGVLLYLQQEGRGIGLINKLRAYNLQDQGFDTVDANLRLGFEIDERNFAPAAKMLQLLGFSSVRLLTNNPQKVAALAGAGIPVAEQVPHQFPSNKHNEKYLQVKRDRTGHLLS